MGLLGEFLELFYSNEHALRTVRASVRREYKSSGAIKTSRSRQIGKQKSSTGESRLETNELEFWSVLPSDVRVDETSTKNGKTQSKTEIVSGKTRLTRTPAGVIESEEVPPSPRQQPGDSMPTDFRRHFDRNLIRQFFASLTLEDAGKCEVAGRDCVRIRAVPIPGARIWPHWLPHEADAFEFAADLTYPSLLSISGLSNGEVFETINVVEVVFNEPIEKSTFEFEPQAIRNIRPARPVSKPITLETAIANASFTLLVPKRGVDELAPTIMHKTGSTRSAGESVSFMYSGNDSKKLWFQLRTKPDQDLEQRLEWEEVEAFGKRFEMSDPEMENGMIVLRFCQNETWIEMFSDYSREKTLDIAGSFEPV